MYSLKDHVKRVDESHVRAEERRTKRYKIILGSIAGLTAVSIAKAAFGHADD